MIKLEKGDTPQVLIDNGEAWSAEYVALKAAGQKNDTIESRHRHPQIKQAVRA